MKKIDHHIPPLMSKLPLDSRGYPIPYFVPIVDGKPEFRYQDGQKRKACLDHGLCSVCGNKLYDKSYWVIAGPIGLRNRVTSDAPMHEDCARYSISVCPHLIYYKAERRSEDLPTNNPNLLRNKATEIFLVKADKYSTETVDGHTYIKFRPKYIEPYDYKDNKLVMRFHVKR